MTFATTMMIALPVLGALGFAIGYRVGRDRARRDRAIAAGKLSATSLSGEPR